MGLEKRLAISFFLWYHMCMYWVLEYASCTNELLTEAHSLLQITFKNEVGQYDLEVTTFQLAVLFAWNQRPREKISFENLKLATELPDAELRRTLWVCFIFCLALFLKCVI